MKKRSFYRKTITVFVSDDMKQKLNEIPNQSLFIREAIQEKLDKEKEENAK